MKSCLLAATLLFLSPWLFAQDFSVAVASDFAEPLKVIKRLFEDKHGYTVEMTAGSSGRLYEEITKGAPFDLYLSADQNRPADLEKQGLGIKGKRFTYAEGSLAVWVSDPAFTGRIPDAFKAGDFNSVVIARPENSSYGKAALQVLEKLEGPGHDKVRLVSVQHVDEAYQTVAAGEVDAGFVALSQVMTVKAVTRGTSWKIPTRYYDTIKQDALLLANGKDNPAANALFRFLQSPQAQAVIVSYGYHLAIK